MIPARGGSKGIPRKNLRSLGGKPLLYYSIKNALSVKCIHRVVVSTDNLEIAEVAKLYGADVISRPLELGEDHITLDPVVYHALETAENEENLRYDIVLTLQPTSPLLQPESIENIIKKVCEDDVDTVITVKDFRHLSWRLDDFNKVVPNYLSRVNRQQLPPNFVETGAVLASTRESIKKETRIGKKISIYELSEEESIDIDTVADWWIVEKLLNRKKIIFRTDGYNEIGLGHVYRCLTIADKLIDHEIIFLMNSIYELGISVVREHNYNVIPFFHTEIEEIDKIKPDIIINDILDTSVEYMTKLKERKVRIINFEDLGPGAVLADAVINALYPSNVPYSNFFTGHEYYCARPEFLLIGPKKLQKKIGNILLSFGGTDPNNLTCLVLKAIDKSTIKFDINVITGPGYVHNLNLLNLVAKCQHKVNVLKNVTNMAKHIHSADLMFTSAGRTMYEAAILGVPCVVIAQNFRELTHIFGHVYHGFINLGLHSNISEEEVFKVFEDIARSYETRKLMNERMLKNDLHTGINRVVKIILGEDVLV